MPRLSIDLLPTTTANADHSPLAVVGEVHKGDGYYGSGDGFHTVAHVLTDWAGTIKIQASLATNPTNDDWVTAYTIENLDTVNLLTESSSANFVGNYVWIRAVVENMTHGTIAKLQLNY